MDGASVIQMTYDMWMSPEAVAQGYSIEDAIEFTDWLKTWMNFLR